MNDDNVQEPELLDDDDFGGEIVNPVTQNVGQYSAQFESIRQSVYQDIQRAGSQFCMNVQQLVKNCVASNIGIYNLAKLHAVKIEKHFGDGVKLLNHTVSNAMFDIGCGNMLLVEFDLANASQSIISAKHLNEVKFMNNYDCISEALLAKRCQFLMARPISDDIIIQYEQYQNQLITSRVELAKSQKLLRETILHRAFTAFEFIEGLSFYTLNFSDDMSMLFWDRYTVTDITAKSYYVEQHCIVEHIVTGDVEPERFIFLHKPSKNSMAAFLSAKLACLTEMVRPQPTLYREQIAEQVHDEAPEYEEEL